TRADTALLCRPCGTCGNRCAQAPWTYAHGYLLTPLAGLRIPRRDRAPACVHVDSRVTNGHNAITPSCRALPKLSSWPSAAGLCGPPARSVGAGAAQRGVASPLVARPGPSAQVRLCPTAAGRPARTAPPIAAAQASPTPPPSCFAVDPCTRSPAAALPDG